MQQVISFRDPFTFFSAWDVLPHSRPFNFFSRKEEGKTERGIANYYEWGPEKLKLKVGGLLLFKKGLRPEWEDKTCGKGGLFLFKVGSGEDDSTIEELWDTLI